MCYKFESKFEEYCGILIKSYMWVKVEVGIFGGGIGLYFCRELRKFGCYIIVFGELGE